MNSGTTIREAERILGYSFHDKDTLLRALTHPSATEGDSLRSSYERLEFLGDSILGAICAHELYGRFLDLNEGELTRLKVALVSGETLSKVADSLGISELIVFGDSERGTEARGLHTALENVFEALVGALYVDGGYEPAREFVLGSLEPYISRDLAFTPESPKSLLQEVVQAKRMPTPTYEIVSSEGPAHAPTFTAVAKVGNERIGRGSGASKKEAETQAARDALKRIDEREDSYTDE